MASISSTLLKAVSDVTKGKLKCKAVAIIMLSGNFNLYVLRKLITDFLMSLLMSTTTQLDKK